MDKFVFQGPRLIVPVALRSTLVSIAHKGQQGEVRTKQCLCDLYWWPGMEVHHAVRSCHVCQLNDKTVKSHPAPLQPVQLPDGPWQKVAVDVVGPFDTASSDYRFAITLTNYYSKWPKGPLNSHCHYGLCGFVSVIGIQSPWQSIEHGY